MKSIHSALVGSASDRHEVLQGAVESIDWRARFEKSPTIFLAAALGGGLLIGSATNHRRSAPPAHSRREFEAAPARSKLGWHWDDSLGVLKSILIGIAITQAKKALFGPTPGRPKVPPDSTTH
ncbi:MAG TPA: hypothetical protein VK696_11360 [Steroidobacteraceae bacterium]|jgi:hypothetical protein|nr:hypothetical protein [Steroidobacteraceae bacterium]